MSVRGLLVSSLSVGMAAFLLYTNLPVVMAQRGMIPTAVAGVVPALLALAVVHRVIVRREPIVVDRTFLLLLAYLLVLLVSAFGAQGYSEAFARIVSFLIEGLLAYFLVRNAVQGLPELRFAIAGVLAASVLLAGLSVLQTVTGNYDQEFLGLAGRSLDHLEYLGATGPDEMGLEDRAFGPVGDPNRFAQILLMALPLVFVVLLNSRRGLSRTVPLVCTLVILSGVVVTYSRGGFLALVALILLAAPLRLIRPQQVFALMLAGMIAVPLAAPAYASRVVSISGVAALFGSTEVEADGPTRGRTTEMLAALAAYTDHAVLGVGPGQYLPFYSVRYQALPEISIRELSEPRRAHSLYLELAAEVGTLGLMVFLSIPLLLLRDLRVVRLRLQRIRPDLARLAGGFTLLILAYLGTGVFLHMAFERYYWFVIGLTAAAAAVLERRTLDTEIETENPRGWSVRPSSV